MQLCELNIETSLIMVVHLYVGDFGIILILFNVYVGNFWKSLM